MLFRSVFRPCCAASSAGAAVQAASRSLSTAVDNHGFKWRAIVTTAPHSRWRCCSRPCAGVEVRSLNASTLRPTRTHLDGEHGSRAPRPGRGEAAWPSGPPPTCAGVQSTGSTRESRPARRECCTSSLLAPAEEARAGQGGRSLAPHIRPWWKAPEQKYGSSGFVVGEGRAQGR